MEKYNPNKPPHAHFICQKCKRSFGVFNFSEVIKIKNKNSIKYISDSKIEKTKIENYRVNFYGVCKECKERYKVIS